MVQKNAAVVRPPKIRFFHSNFRGLYHFIRCVFYYLWTYSSTVEPDRLLDEDVYERIQVNTFPAISDGSQIN